VFKKLSSVIGLHAKPSKPVIWLLASIPVVIIIIIYLVASDIRHAENASDKLLPGVSQMVSAMSQMAFEEDRRTGDILLWKDTYASLKRLLIGIVVAAMLGLMLGLHLALFPIVRAIFGFTLTFVSMVPPLAILPILFIVVGIDELAKVTLIVLGVFPMIARDILMATQKIPKEQITKALTLGASHLGVAYRIILPQIFPRLIESVRLSLGAGWLFLIAAEAIAATEGLGYRIFLVRRYLSMDIIIPYVIWITIIGFTIDFLLRLWIRKRYKWYDPTK